MYLSVGHPWVPRRGEGERGIALGRDPGPLSHLQGHDVIGFQRSVSLNRQSLLQTQNHVEYPILEPGP